MTDKQKPSLFDEMTKLNKLANVAPVGIPDPIRTAGFRRVDIDFDKPQPWHGTLTPTDFGVTFKGEYKITPVKEIVDAFRIYGKDLVKLGVTEIVCTQSNDPKLFPLKVDIKGNQQYANKDKIHKLFEKIAMALSTDGRDSFAVLSHGFGSGYSVDLIAELKPTYG